MAHFGAIRAAVAAILKRNLRMKYNVASAMATQIALVLSGIRSGYLVDGMSLRKHDLQLILQHVQDGSPSEIAAIWETTTEQAFFINTFLLKAKLEAESLPLWVSTTNPSQLVPEPHSFQTLLGKIILEPGSLSTISTDQPTDMVPFAAWLLDYPVAYVVTDPEGPFLTNVALQVYDCTLNWQDERIALIKFSVPQSLGVDDLSSIIVDTFQPRLVLNGFGKGEPAIHHDTIRLDRVVL